ncbi:hypothetical protein ACZ90_24910 [Streptomyces albus subsp. albus]|nr:hypothetical protein ACZ90_24910 [Streptomyces albus subsp. albus]
MTAVPDVEQLLHRMRRAVRRVFGGADRGRVPRARRSEGRPRGDRWLDGALRDGGWPEDRWPGAGSPGEGRWPDALPRDVRWLDGVPRDGGWPEGRWPGAGSPGEDWWHGDALARGDRWPRDGWWPGDRGGAPGWGAARQAGRMPAGAEEWELPEERELRDFLERAVPLLPAPAERMLRVRERVRARRRRRAGGAAAVLLAVTALAAALVSWPSPGDPRAGALAPHRSPRGTAAPLSGPPGAEPSAPRSAPPPGASPYPGAADGGVHASIRAAGGPVRYPDLADLTIRVPNGWQALAVAGHGRGQSAAFAGQQRLASSRHPCLTRGDSCVPVSRLESGRGVIGFRLMRGHLALARARVAPALREARLSKDCRVAGGSRELRGWIVVGDSAPDTVVRVSVCLNAPSAASMGQVRHVLDSATFGGDAPPAPGSRRD